MNNENIGDTKTIKKFCWYPKKINNIWVWFRFYSETYEYKEDLIRREIPHPTVVCEDGSPFYGIPKHYVWEKTKRWIKTKRK